jgi:hypothetical protein
MNQYFQHSLGLINRWDDLCGLEELLQSMRNSSQSDVEHRLTNTNILMEKLLTPIA